MSGRPLDPKAVQKLIRSEAKSANAKRAAQAAARVGCILIDFVDDPDPVAFSDARYELRATATETFVAVIQDGLEFLWPSRSIAKLSFGFGENFQRVVSEISEAGEGESE